MSFGQKVLERYGWKKGDGLGKHNDGIKEAIKPKRKANNLGLGFKLGAEFQDNWWENLYNEATSNICVDNKKDEVKVKSLNEDGELLPHKRKKSKKGVQEKYSLFQKANSVEEFDDEDSQINNVDDSTLFKKCGGRTVHKGARHGLTLSGKLSRLEKQDEEILPKVKRKKLKQ